MEIDKTKEVVVFNSFNGFIYLVCLERDYVRFGSTKSWAQELPSGFTAEEIVQAIKDKVEGWVYLGEV